VTTGADAFLDGLLEGLGDLFDPILRASADPDALAALLQQVGWILDPASAAVPAELGAIATSVEDLLNQVGDLTSDDDSKVSAAESKAMTDVEQIAVAVAGLAGTPGVPDALRDPDLPAKLIELLVYDYLSDFQPGTFALTRLVGMLDEVPMPAPPTPANSPFARPYLERRIDFTRVATLVTNPGEIPGDVYGWGTAAFDADKLLRVLEIVGIAFGLPRSANTNAGLDLYWNDAAIDQQAQRSLAIPLWNGTDTSGGAIANAELDLVVVPIPPTAPGTPTTSPEGIAIFPFLDADASFSTDVADGVTFTLTAHAEIDGFVRAELRPSGAALVFDPGKSVDDAAMTAHVDVAPADPIVVIGAKDSSRLQIAQAHAEVGVELKLGEPQMRVSVGLDKASIVIDLGEGDGFIQKLLGGAPQQMDLGFGVDWSTTEGVRFEGSATLRLQLSVHLDLAGVVQIDTVYLVLGAVTQPGPGLSLEVSVAGGLSLGPFAAQVDRIGVTLNFVERKSDHAGTLGDLDLVFGFKPPNGLGFVVDAGPVVGGGYVSFDTLTEEYAGILDLEVADLFAVKAIGVLSTKMPDGKPGFSMMLIITAEFPPIQLGYGFTLNGVGGAVGVNRTMDQQFLSNGIHTGALESILFPPDPVAHANEVISNIKQGFPLAEGRFIFGPMVKIGWASVISIEAGILLELPTPIKLALLGRLACILPEPDAAILVLQLDLAGFIDFGTGDIAVDADLVDSRIVEFPLTGGFALRANVGSNPAFALSAGGFHPKFTPPPGFPKLDRVGLAIGDDNPRLRLESYFAVTTNTVQTGANADFYASADFGALGTFSAAADLGFDALIHFSPFQLQTEVYGSAAIKRNGDDLCSADLDLLLTGPEPWHARGQATVHFMGDHSLGFDRTFGPDAPPQALPATNVADLVRQAIGDAGAWGAVPPSGDHSLVTLRDIGPTNGVLLHPRAELTVHQRVAPLDTALAQYGQGPIDGPTTISIDSVTVAGMPGPGAVGTIDDDFAPAQYFALSDDEKLSRPSFEKLPAGRSVQTSSFLTGTSQGADQDYVTLTVDNPKLAPDDDPKAAPYTAAAELRASMAELVGGRLAGPGRYASPSQGIVVQPPAYALAGRRDLKASGSYQSYTAAAAARSGNETKVVGAFEAR
jgi:hypothetical protein